MRRPSTTPLLGFLAIAIAGCGKGPDGDLEATGGYAAAGSLCPSPSQQPCNGACVDFSSDAANCGACSNACQAGQSCQLGVCQCLGALLDCSGACVDTRSDGLNCGTCGNVCPAGQVCSLGQCGATCAQGQSLCATSCVDVMTHPLHCGACGVACALGQSCVDGACSADLAGSGGAGGSGGSGGVATGGGAPGGAPTGGVATAGPDTGGASTGGVSTGGASTGGTTTGGASTGGSGGQGGTTEWPQCFSGDTMPRNPGLRVDPEATGYATAIDTDGYVTMLIGPDRPACITDAVALRNLAELDEGLREVVEVVGFPAFPEWKQGHFLNWVILNSGIPGATLPNEGGYQGNRWGHMNFESTSTCPCVWDDYQAGGALHECVHALQSELWKFNNRASGWAHEAHNNYLTTQANALVRSQYSMGWSASLVLQMPHVPIESMGLFTDDYVAGPADQGASGRTYVNNQVRYGLEIFFLSLAQTMGRGFVNCLWMEAPTNNQQSIFQVLHGYGGDEAVANAVLTFAAKSALLDFDEWTDTMRSLMRGRWNDNFWFYMYPGGDGTSTFRPPAKTTPHHQGRNIIPIRLGSGATSVTVELTPDATGSLGTPARMQAQLAYRDSADEPVYGPVFASGQSSIEVPNGARNGVVNLVVAVTNPNADSGSDDGSNKGFDGQEHFSYQARIVSGGTIAPTSTRPW